MTLIKDLSVLLQRKRMICESRGLKMNRFIEEALLDKLEELEDVEDLRTLLCEPTRPLTEILKDLKLDGMKP